MSLRFEIGDAVECNMGQGNWAGGVVVKLNYREDDWKPERVAPYQVRLNIGGHLIYAPKDIDKYIRGKKPKVPVTILTGFLGAGKTTLLNHLLGADHGKKIGVIENEFGAVSIDSALLKTGQKRTSEEVIIEMKNGCVCCTVRKDLATAFKDIMQGRELDHIVIETTGMANPAPVIQTFHLDEFAQLRLKLDAVLTIVDAKHIEQHLSEERKDDSVNEALEQVAFADRILLNKVDLVTPADIKRVERALRGINTNAQIQHTQLAKEMPPLDTFFCIDAFNIEKILTEDPAFLKDTETHEEEEEGHAHGHGHSHDGHGHSHGDGEGKDCAKCHEECPDKDNCPHQQHAHNKLVNSFCIRQKGDVRMNKLNEFFTVLIQNYNEDMYRYKGILAVEGAPMKFVFQGVHMIINTTPSAKWKPSETRESILVFIGKRMKEREEAIRQLFDACLVEPQLKAKGEINFGGKDKPVEVE